MMYYNDLSLSHMFGFGYIFMFLFWGILTYGAILLFRHNNGSHDKSRPLDILKERYAKGEITKDQFDIMNKDLQ